MTDLSDIIIKPEVLAPAGDLERLNAAVSFGADAVYLGGEMFGMRTSSANFNFENLKKAVELAHSNGVKVYFVCNTLPRNEEIPFLAGFVKDAASCGIDAFIVSDIGVLFEIKRIIPDAEIHISTQAGIVNYLTARTFYDLGAKRVVLARELTLEEISDIRAKVPSDLEIEVFVHGSMCVSFSGRCLLSNYLTGRDSNRGDCAQPCRWKYRLVEEKRPNEYYPIFEDDKGSHILNASDLSMVEHIPELVKAGVTSFKIEGRAKSAYYTAVVTNMYRAAVDEFMKKPGDNFRPSQWILDELEKVSHRKYSTGFFYGRPENAQIYDNGGYERSWNIVAIVTSCSNGRIYAFQKNKFFDGDPLEALQTEGKPVSLVADDLRDADGNRIEAACHAVMDLSFKSDKVFRPGTILRKKMDE